MTTSTSLRIIGGVAAALLLTLTASVHAAAPQSGGIYLEVESDGGGQVQTIKLSLGADSLRMDTEQGVSLVSVGGDGGKMLMIQHAEQQYMEFTAEMMKAMAGMMGQMPAEVEQEVENITPPTFTRTGNTKQVGAWNAYEVRVEHPDQDGEMTMWFSPDVDADFRSLAQQVVDSVSSLLNSPLARMGGAGGGAGIMQQIEAQMSAVDMPDGFPVQIISAAGGTTSTTTLRAIDLNPTFGPETWEAPAGYTKMDMPFIR